MRALLRGISSSLELSSSLRHSRFDYGSSAEAILRRRCSLPANGFQDPEYWRP